MYLQSLFWISCKNVTVRKKSENGLCTCCIYLAFVKHFAFVSMQ